ncbi:cytochrome c-1-like [Neodiprion virginianus]|uniref:cytochrome c-1-like n=1 Tax=Neodiprion fabricii TaxID=2872261 RepID=UPI001ED97962|nr:cytochrome c-1-like [Neodiprion fabricii]XP_046626456.1 cytochrome c-1-like [Neodiprion virginianus]
MGDAANGKKLFTKLCATCHTMDKGGKHKIGPNLNGILGRSSGSAVGFAYSEAMKSKRVTWNDNNMDEYLKAPKKFVPGTKMVFPGIKKAEDRRDVIAFLNSQK